MTRVFSIAKAELMHMFYSPLAWIGSIILFMFFAFDYVKVVDFYFTANERGGSDMLYNVKALTTNMTLHCPGLALVRRLLMSHSKFLLPFIMMGVISREISQGTIKLIYSSPVLVRSFVIGKFLGLVLFNLFLIAIFFVVITGLTFTIGSPDVGLLLWQLAAIFIYFVFISSICLFASSLTSYAIVGCIYSIIILILLGLINNLGQGGPLADYFYPLSHTGIINRLITGGIDLNDLVVLMIFTSLFFLLTIIKLENGIKPFTRIQKTLRFAGLPVIAFLLIAIIPYRPIGYLDVTRNKRHALPNKVSDILKQMDKGPLKVTHYFNIMFYPDNRTSFHIPTGRPYIKYETWRNYMRYKDDIHVNYKYYFDTSAFEIKHILKGYEGYRTDEIRRILADTYGYDLNDVIDVNELKKELPLEENQYITHLVKLNYTNRESIVRNFGEDLPGLENYYPALLNLMSDRGKEILFCLDGNTADFFYDDRRSSDITQMRNRLSWINIGPGLDSIRLERQNIPSTAKGLIVAAPRDEMPEIARNKINQFISEGGNVLFSGEPEFKDYIQPLLNEFGITIRRDVVVQPTEDRGSKRVLGYVPKKSLKYLWQLDSVRSERKRVNLDTVNVVLDVCSALDISKVKGWEATPLIYSRRFKSWNIPNMKNYDSLVLKLSKRTGDEDGSFPLAVLLTREVKGKLQKVIVSGDVDIMRYMAFSNGEYSDNMQKDILALLTDGEFPPNFNEKTPPDNYFKISLEGKKQQRLLYMYLLPGIMVFGAGTYLLKRNRK